MSRSKSATRAPPLETLRRSGRCHRYQQLLSERNLPMFPVQRVAATEFDYFALLEQGFNLPLIVTGYSDSFGIKIPSRETSDMHYVASKVGPTREVRIIDVGEQSELYGYTIQQYADHLTSKGSEKSCPELGARSKVLNMISLEFSGTNLANEVSSPDFVNRIDWVRCIWPTERMSRGDYPHVQKYCLAGMAGSYTDFHIDFGGTSVWYHILQGRKRFYLIPPTTPNLLAYQRWTTSADQGDVFLGDLCPDQCFVLDLSIDETLLLPSGWIHSVYTPEDSVVFGGNFLHSYSILRQLQSFEIECSTRVGKAFLFPGFKPIHWYFLTELLLVTESIYSQEPGSVVFDEEDDSNIVQLICLHLHRPAVLRQLPLLVKKSDQWLIQAKHNNLQESRTYTAAAQSCGLGDGQVVARWWELLLRIAEHAAYSHADHAVDEALLQELRQHIEYVRNLVVSEKAGIDLFDEKLVRAALPGFDRQLDEQLRLLPTLPLPTPVPKPEALVAPLVEEASAGEERDPQMVRTRGRRMDRSIVEFDDIGLDDAAQDDASDADFNADEGDDDDDDDDGKVTGANDSDEDYRQEAGGHKRRRVAIVARRQPPAAKAKAPAAAAASKKDTPKKVSDVRALILKKCGGGARRR